MAGYISSNKAKINLLLPKLKKTLGVVGQYESSSPTEFSLKLIYNGRVGGIDSLLRFDITVVLKEDKIMDDFASFFNNHTLSIRIILKSKKQSHLDSVWHYDTEDKKFNLMHPKYHFQFGGTMAKQLGMNCFDTPRIFTLPIDYFTAIDFFVCNFFEENVAKPFREENSYAAALRASQLDVIKKYHDLIYRYITRDTNDAEKAIVKMIIPSIVI